MLKKGFYLLVVVSIVLVAAGTFRQALRLGDLSIMEINRRRQYFPKPVAPLFANKLIAANYLVLQKAFSRIPR